MKHIWRTAGAENLETILVVEDEAPIRMLIWHILNEAGYRVIVASDVVDAIQKLGAGPKVDLVLTDIAMPGMNGFELARFVRRAFPETKVVYATGSQDLYPEFRDATRCIIKPFGVSELLSAVRETLDGRGTAIETDLEMPATF